MCVGVISHFYGIIITIIIIIITIITIIRVTHFEVLLTLPFPLCNWDGK